MVNINLVQLFNSAKTKLILLVVSLYITMGSIAAASTLQEPGFTETTITSIAAATNGYGGVAVDNSGNLYFAANAANEVYIIPPTGVAAQFGTIAASTALGVVIDGNNLYSSFGNPNTIYRQDLTQAAPVGVSIATPTNRPMGMAIAPAGFGAFGGMIIVADADGVSVINPANGNVTQLWDANTNISDVAFTLAGEIVAVRDNGDLIQITSAGVATVITSGLGGSDGVAVHPVTGEIYVADPNGDTIWKVQPDGSSPTAFATNVLVDSGFFPSPIAFSPDGADLFYITRESGSTIYRISGFPTLSIQQVPTLSTWMLILLTLLLGIVGLRKRI